MPIIDDPIFEEAERVGRQVDNEYLLYRIKTAALYVFIGFVLAYTLITNININTKVGKIEAYINSVQPEQLHFNFK